jgi:peptidoglycan/xylan/chitin deacetylase (PgdA/CDA1 family)
LSILFCAACDRPKATNRIELEIAEDLEELDMSPEPMQLPEKPPKPIIDKGSRVTFLGYHQIITKGNPGEMKIMATKFRSQMQSLKDAEIPVISLSDYLEWRAGSKEIPETSVIITIDDGYDDLVDVALPILKEFGYPFTFYLYTNFLGGSGRTLSENEVRALIEGGGELGSHSISHDFLVRAKRKFGDKNDYEDWLSKEIKGSKESLEKKFGVAVNSFAYPYGEYNESLAKRIAEAGYSSAVTVNGAKSGYETPLYELPRYIIHGNNDINWKAGTSFRGKGGLVGSRNIIRGSDKSVEKLSQIKVWPENGKAIIDRLPILSVNISNYEEIDPDSINMKVSGFGRVPAIYDKDRGIISWAVKSKLRGAKYTVNLSFSEVGKEGKHFAAWSFLLERNVFYLPDYKERVKAERLESVKVLEN